MRTSRRGQDGATLAEVALMVGLVAVVVLGAVKGLGGRSSAKLNTAGAGIHQTAAGSDGGGSSGGSSGGSGGGGSEATTTAPPTTAPPTTAPTTTTTTTTATTTTTTPPTTTTTPPLVGTASFGSATSARSGSSNWVAGATLTLKSTTGTPLPGAVVTIRVRAYKSGGSYTDTTVTVTVGADGTIDVDTGPYRRTGTTRITSVTYTVTDVDPPGTSTWNGTQATTTIAAAA